MPKRKLAPVPPSREKGQISIDLPNWMWRYVPPWNNPGWIQGKVWREVVAAQPIAVICRDTLISMITSLDWRIEARDSNERDERKSEIDYYTKFFEDNDNIDYTSLIEWIGTDCLDLPFGGAIEVGREGNSPEGQLAWIVPLDGATMFPTLDQDYPYAQYVPEAGVERVLFPKFRIDRIGMSPRTDIKYEGWFMAPPEKIYLALQLLNRGDRYYANLLLDTPPAGILDLKDMEEESAKKWLESWHQLLNGTDPFKIPVLYEHENVAEFVSFTKSPTELMFDKATLKYAAINAAAYGLSLSDIGLSTSGNGGETLAGSIREERKTRKTGLAVMKRKLIAFFNRLLPPYLQWSYIDLDDEVSVSVGRARLADAQAWDIMVKNGSFSPEEARQQFIADGLTSVPLPEKPPKEAVPQSTPAGSPKRNELTQSPVPASAGGQGEIRNAALEYAMEIDPDFKAMCLELESRFDTLSEDEKIEVTKEFDSLTNGIIENAKEIDKQGENSNE